MAADCCGSRAGILPCVQLFQPLECRNRSPGATSCQPPLASDPVSQGRQGKSKGEDEEGSGLATAPTLGCSPADPSPQRSRRGREIPRLNPRDGDPAGGRAGFSLCCARAGFYLPQTQPARKGYSALLHRHPPGLWKAREDHAEDRALTAGWSRVWESHPSWNAAQGSKWEVTFSSTG